LESDKKLESDDYAEACKLCAPILVNALNVMELPIEVHITGAAATHSPARRV
jgi:hypothetical protein